MSGTLPINLIGLIVDRTLCVGASVARKMNKEKLPFVFEQLDQIRELNPKGVYNTLCNVFYADEV